MKNLLNFGKVVLAALLLVFVASGCSKKKTAQSENSQSGEATVSKALQRIRKAGVLKVGSSGDVYAYIDQKTGEFTGIDGEICKELAKRLDIPKVEMVLIPFSELILNLNNGNIDIIADGMYARADRAKQIYYGDVWYTQGGALLVPEDSNVESEYDFDPKTSRVGYTPGTVWHPIVEGWEKEGLIKTAVATGLQADSIVALQFGKIDGFYTDYPAVEELMIKAPEQLAGLRLAKNYKDKPDALGRIAPSVKFADKDFMKEINAEMIKIREEGLMEEMFKKCYLDPSHYMITNSEADLKHGVNTIPD